jgi:NAD(P)-dependent dehydrogenase (short-subunit alcohol dehydrogenase family)
MNRLKDKIIVITGGNSGIGYSTAEKVIAEGATAVIVGRDSEKVKNASSKLGEKAKGFVCDVSNSDEITSLFKKIGQSFDKIHGVVANAGIAVLENVEKVSEKSFDLSINTNLKGAFFTAQKALPLMREGGSIVFNASVAA